MPQLESLTTGNHVFAVYTDIKDELDECFAFLKAGFQNGEAVWITEEDLTKDEIRERIRKEWNVENLEELEANGDITITTSREWYYPDGNFDLEKVVAKWQKAVEDAVARGKKGLRAFDAVDGLLKDGFADELVAFEAVLGTSFKIPFTAICAYKAPDVANSMTGEQLSTLNASHGLHRTSSYNVLENPPINQHIALMFENDDQCGAAIARYINEGLKRNQLCVYASVHNRDENHVSNIASKIDDYEKNVKEGNLLVTNLAPAYVAAISDDLSPYKELAAQLAEMTKDRKDKHVRLVADCAMFMFQNKHFDECTMLEAWGQEKPIFGSYVCPYPKSLFDKYPFNYHKFRILANHDLAVDTGGHIIAAYQRKEVGQ